MSKLGQCGWNDSYVTGTKTVGANDNGNEETRTETALCNSGCMPRSDTFRIVIVIGCKDGGI